MVWEEARKIEITVPLFFIMNPQQNLKPLLSSDSPASFAHVSLSLQKGEWLWRQKRLSFAAMSRPKSAKLSATRMSYRQMT